METKTRSTLSEAASAVSRYLKDSYEAEQLDALFDGGEFSTPEHLRYRPIELRDLLLDLGWTVEDFEAELIERTSERWVHFSGLTHDLPADHLEP